MATRWMEWLLRKCNLHIRLLLCLSKSLLVKPSAFAYFPDTFLKLLSMCSWYCNTQHDHDHDCDNFQDDHDRD